MSTHPSDANPVLQANEAFYRAFEQLDLSAMSSAWVHSPNALCVHPGWDLLRGWATIERSFQLIFESTTYVEFDIEPLSVRMDGHQAWIVCYENLLTATEGPAERARILATNAFVYDRTSTWRLIHHHASQIRISPPDLTVPRG